MSEIGRKLGPLCRALEVITGNAHEIVPVGEPMLEGGAYVQRFAVSQKIAGPSEPETP